MVALIRACTHLLEVVPRTEGLAGGGEYHHVYTGFGRDLVQCLLQRREHALGQGVVLCRPVEGDRRDVPVVGAPEER